MKNLTVLLHLLALLTFLSCKKDTTTNISGHITTLGTDDPVEDAKLILFGGVSDGEFFNTSVSYYRLDSTYSDANGFYEFNFDTGEYAILQVRVEKDDYFTQNIPQGLIPSGDNLADVVLEPFAWLKLHVKNVMQEGEFDSISIGNSFEGYPTLTFYGAVDTTIIGLVKGNSNETKAIWFVTKNGIQQNYNEPIYCSAQDTTFFDIFY